MKCVAVKLLSQNSLHRRLEVVVVSLLASYVCMAVSFKKVGVMHIAYLVRGCIPQLLHFWFTYVR